MRLADFILANREPILAEWEAFARTCVPAGGPMDVAALRDHADQMLTVIAADLASPQARLAQSEKAKGRAPDDDDTPTAAEEHGTGRARSGFTIGQMVAEYRALRASVIRLWTAAEGALDVADIEDLTRFNEAVDQALAESVLRFNEDVEQAKETFLAILGHDLRTPLGAISTSATFLLDAGDLEAEVQRRLLAGIAGSATRSVTMVGDLLDFTRSRLGDGIPIARADMDLGEVVRDVVDEIAAAHPACPITVDTRPEPRGQWDAARLRQAFGNLIANAVQHGADGTTVTVDVREAGGEVTVAVHNRGAVIPPEQLDGLFNPMKARGASRTAAARGPTGSLGLGLYIAEQIVHAHDGRIGVESSEACGTTFTVHLPRRAASTAGA
jgi:signal transduction histidine kinase